MKAILVPAFEGLNLRGYKGLITFRKTVDLLLGTSIREFLSFLERKSCEKGVARRKIVKYPACGFRFEVSYARVSACSGCSSLISCDYVRCPRCGEEFPEA